MLSWVWIVGEDLNVWWRAASMSRSARYASPTEISENPSWPCVLLKVSNGTGWYGKRATSRATWSRYVIVASRPPFIRNQYQFVSRGWKNLHSSAVPAMAPSRMDWFQAILHE